jgi:hypothetical protein
MRSLAGSLPDASPSSVGKGRSTRAGMPATSVFGGTSRVTIAPAATTAPAPTVTPARMVARAPSQAPSPMTMGRRSCLPQRCSLPPI